MLVVRRLTALAMDGPLPTGVHDLLIELYGPAEDAWRCSDESVAQAELFLGRSLPTVLSQYYRFAGSADFNRAEILLSPLYDIRRTTEWVTFATQDVSWQFAYRTVEQNKADPSVWLRMSPEGRYERAVSTVSVFLARLICCNAAAGKAPFGGKARLGSSAVSNALRTHWEPIELEISGYLAFFRLDGCIAALRPSQLVLCGRLSETVRLAAESLGVPLEESWPVLSGGRSSSPPN